MTIEKAIKYWEQFLEEIQMIDDTCGWGVLEKLEQTDATNTALSALRTQQKADKPLTNADHLRAMTDDELAEFIAMSPVLEFCVCKLCKFGNSTPQDDRGQCLTNDGVCRAEEYCEAFKKWLKQPYDGGKNRKRGNIR